MNIPDRRPESVGVTEYEWVKVRAIVRRRIRRLDDQEDALQQVSVSLFYALSRFGTCYHDDTARAKFINKITSNICATVYNAATRRDAFHVLEDPVENPADGPDVDTNSFYEIYHVRYVLDQLPKAQRELLLRLADDETCVDIAGTSYSPEAIRYHWRKARDNFVQLYLDSAELDDL